jgi:signal transduction histidine kinase
MLNFSLSSWKGYGFVIVTGVLLYFLCYLWLRRLQNQTTLLVQSERRSIAGMASASIAHDLNNMLMSLYGFMEELKVSGSEDEFVASAHAELQLRIEELAQLSKSLARAAKRLEPGAVQDIDLSQRINIVAKLLMKHPDVRTCSLQVDALDSAMIRVNAELFDQAALNLVMNAAQAAGPNGEIHLSLRSDDGKAVLQVEDSGPGIDDKELGRIFSPGYTTKTEGSGIGLLSVRAFADSCRANLKVERSQLGGAAFSIEIPAA